jgi:hypothetical protein
MKYIVPHINILLVGACAALAFTSANAQTFPAPGFTLPPGKSIVITYEADVNANACPNNTVPVAKLSNQSNVTGSNFATVQTDDPDIAGASDATLTPSANISVGNLVYNDVDRNGFFDGSDLGINGVLLNLYADLNNNNRLDAGDGMPLANTTTSTVGMQAGTYAFDVCPGTYILEVAPSNFAMGGALYNSGQPLVSSPTTGAPDPDLNTTDNDDNGNNVSGFGIACAAFTVSAAINHVDFGFKTPSTVTINDLTLSEGSGAGPTAFHFTVTRSTNEEAFSLTVNTAAGTAAAGTDFTAISGGAVSFTNGGNLTETIIVNVTHDNMVEADETFLVNLTGAPEGVVITDGAGEGKINNDDNATLTLAVAGGGASQNEGSAFTFNATLNNPVQGGFQVAYTTDNGGTNPAAAGSDYTDNDGLLTFAGNAAESQSWTVSTINDNTVELDETISAVLGSISMTSAIQAAAITINGSPQTATLLNNDAATVSIQSDVSQPETATPQNFSVTLSNPVDVNVTVLFSTAAGTATAGSDYTTVTNQTVTFPAGTNTAQTVGVVIATDNIVEADETFTASIGTLNPGGRNVSLGTDSRTGTINNDDDCTLNITPLGGVIQNEGNSGTTNFVFSVTPTNPVQGGFSVAYTTSDGTATTADNDYVDNDASLNFPDISTTPQNITVQVNGDNKVEADETFTVQLGSVSGTALGGSIHVSNMARTGAIINDEVDWGDAPDPAYPTLSAGNGARHATLLGFQLGAGIDGEADGQPDANAAGDGTDDDGVTLPGTLVVNTAANITVNASAAGVVNAWVDFNLNGSWESPGEQICTNTAVAAGNNALSFPVPASAVVGTTYARFRFSSAQGLTPTGNAADGEVEDYKIEMVNTLFSIDNPTVAEGNTGTSNLKFRISRNVNANACSIQYAITGGTATAGDGDYQNFASGTADFTAGGPLFQDISVSVNGDSKVELDETVIVTLSNPVNASIAGGMGAGTGTVTNDDQGVITISNPTVTEGDAGALNASFSITLNNPADADITLNYTTQDGTATVANNDYQHTANSLTFTPGQTLKSVNVPVNGDCAIESAENFLLRLGTLQNLGRNVIFSGNNPTLDGTGTIDNDDALPVITCTSFTSYDTDPGSCSAQITLPLPGLNSVCGSSTLEWRRREVNASNQPIQSYSGYFPSTNRTAAFNKGRFEVEWNVSDASGSATCSYFIEIKDNTPPSITCPPPATVSCASAVPAVNLASVTASDNCGSPTKSHVGDTPSNVVCANIRTITRTYRAEDGAGNSTTCAQIITVNDVTLPNFSNPPANTTVQCNAVPNPATSVTATDNCGGAVTVEYLGQTRADGNCPSNYTLSRRWRATDLCGNVRTHTQVINVTDNQGPVFSGVPANVTVQCNAVPTPATSVTAVDNCSSPVTITVNNTVMQGACLNSYIIIRRWTAADNCGNTRTATQRITVVDTQAPTFANVPANLTLQCSDPLPTPGTPSATDNCNGQVTIHYLGQTTTGASCANTYQLLRRWRATDACGNSAVTTQIITVQDTQPPVFTNVPAHITIQCSTTLPFPGTAAATDNCQGSVQTTFLGQFRTDGNCLNNYTITRSWRAIDQCGNSVTATQLITVVDTQNPGFQNPPANVTVTCNNIPGVPAVVGQDNCGSATVAYLGQSQSSGDCQSGYTISRTWRATDLCGNQSSYTQTITVQGQNLGNGGEERSMEEVGGDWRKGEENEGEGLPFVVRLMPNPASDVVQVRFELEQLSEVTIQVSDLSGRVVHTRTYLADAGENVYMLELEALAGGVYLVQVRAGDRRSAGKLIVKS